MSGASLLYPWQGDDWRQLQRLQQRLPHALLFHGAAGIGKSHFVEQFAQSLLCESRQSSGEACGVCGSCTWFVQHNHPDYRLVRPEALEDEGEGSDGGEADGAAAKSKASKTPSKEIKIDQVRALADFMNISTHRQGKRVVVLYPAEALNTAASNALLKTLEEPPADTVFLLVSNSLDRLLPTILSRCRKVALAKPEPAVALAWLAAQGVTDAESALAEQGGAPLAALREAQSGEREELAPYLQFLAAPSIDGALKTADKFQKTPLTQLVALSQRWLYDLFSCQMTAAIRYYPRQQAALAALAARVDRSRLLAALQAIGERRAIADHPLAPKLFIEDMLLDYCALFSSTERP
jgi:DNA polymerase-3 subunit delta'